MIEPYSANSLLINGSVTLVTYLIDQVKILSNIYVIYQVLGLVLLILVENLTPSPSWEYQNLLSPQNLSKYFDFLVEAFHKVLVLIPKGKYLNFQLY